ncbi:MAG: hypothetical protein V9H69_13545 [Anaerolineae bacterium]
MITDFHDLPTRSLANSFLRVDYLAEAGPRLVRLYLAGSELNLLADAAGISYETPYGVFNLHGGHRLWHAPEAFPRTYLPDNDGQTVDEFEGGVRLRQPTEQVTGIQKSIELRLDPQRPALTVQHSLHNVGLWPVELAPWAITQVALGGVAVLPQAAPASSSYLPNRRLNLWPYASWRDPRLHLGDDLALVAGQTGEQALKIGYFNHAGWMGYLLGDIFFVKRFTPQPGRPHPDLNSNCEVYVWDRFLEIETLGPLATVEPGAAVVHVESWELHRAPGVQPTSEALCALAQSLDLPLL